LGFIFSYSFYRTITETNAVENTDTLKIILFPLIFSIISIPYMYFFKLIVEYENLFFPLKFGRKRRKELDFLIKLKLILFCNFQLNKLQKIIKMNSYNLMSISPKDEIEIMIKSYKNALLREPIKCDTAQTRPTWITLKTSQTLASANKSSSEDGTPLGVGNYYSSTGKAFIDVSDCPKRRQLDHI
jgi:hypothetical protein